LSADCLSSFPIDFARERDGSVSRDYVNVVQILSAGLSFPEHSTWDELLGASICVLQTEKRERAISKLLLEPIAGLLMNREVGYAHYPASSMFKHALSIPFSGYDKQDANAPAFPSALFSLADRILGESYKRFDTLLPDGIATFIGSLVPFLESSTLPFAPMFLDKLQGSLGLYVKDASRKLALESGTESRISDVVSASSKGVTCILT
jgi:hypothetical protein